MRSYSDDNGSPGNAELLTFALSKQQGQKMPLLFSYGTLQDEAVQCTLFGRTLVGRRDYLLGYEQALARVEDPEFARTSGKSHHFILRPASGSEARVSGTALEVTDQELECADDYEPAEYKRVVAKLASGGDAWVYVDAKADSKQA